LLDYSWLVPVKGLDEDEALALIEECLERRAALSAEVVRGMAKVSDLLAAYKDELARLMSESISRAR